MPSKTMKATKTLNLGTVSTTPTPYRLKKLTVRTPGRDDRQDYPKDGSILAAVLVAEAEDRKIKGAKIVTGTAVNLRLTMPAALGLLHGLLAVIHPLEIAANKETSDALKHAQETIDEAVEDLTSAVKAAVASGTIIETRTFETVPATLDNDPPAEGRPLVDVLTEGEDRPDPTQTQEIPPACADLPGSPSSESASLTPDRSSEVAEQNDAYVPDPSVN